MHPTRPRAALAALAVMILAACTPAEKRPDAPVAADAPAAPTADTDANAALMAGEFAWQDGRSESAARHFVRAAKLSPDPKIAEHATRVALVAKQWALASEALARWRELEPGAEGLAPAQAGLALLQDDRPETDRLLAALLENDAEGRKQVAQVLLAAPDKEAAIATIERLSIRPDLPGGAEGLVLLSQIAQQLKKDVLALALAEKAVARHADSAAAWTWRGHLKLRGDDKGAAKADFAKALELDPKSRELRLTYAAVLNELGDAATAARSLEDLEPDEEVLSARAAYAARAEDEKLMRSAYDALVALPEPRSAERLELLGQMAELLEDREDALRWYRGVPAGDSWLGAQLRIAVLLDRSGKPDDAIKHIEKLRTGGIDDDARLAESYLLEAELLTARDLDERALDAYRRGLEAVPDDRRLLYARALLNERLDRVSDAEKDLRRVVELDPEDADALNALGYTLADRTQRFDEALQLIEKALKMKPDEPAIVDSMGWVQYRLGRHDEAVRHLRRAFELQPDAEIAAHLGEVLWVKGEREEAQRVWNEGKRKDADNATLRKTIERLKP